jgi:hypothetical protein
MGKLKKGSNWLKVDKTAYTDTSRLKVPGGWLYKHVIQMAGPTTLVNLAFVPEPRKARKVVI